MDSHPQLSDELLPPAFVNARSPSSSSERSTLAPSPLSRPAPYTPPSRPVSKAKAAVEAKENISDDFGRMMRLLGTEGGGKAADSSSRGRESKAESVQTSAGATKALLGLGPPPTSHGRVPLRQTSSSSAVPLSHAPSADALLTVPARPHSATPTPSTSSNIFASPVKHVVLAEEQATPTLAQLQSAAHIGTGESTSPSSLALGLPPAAPLFAPAKDITIEEDPFAPSSIARLKPKTPLAGVPPPSTPGRPSSDDSSSSDEFPYHHHMPTRQNHTSPYPSKRPSSSSAWHRHQTSLPQDFCFASPMPSDASSALDADATLPQGPSSPPPQPPSSGNPLLSKRRFSRSASQPTRSNILSRPPVFNTFVPTLPPYQEALQALDPPRSSPAILALEEAPSSSNGDFRSHASGARVTSLTMQRAQREALEEQQQTTSASPPAVDDTEALAHTVEDLEEGPSNPPSTSTTPADERREFLTRPLGLLALSQALSAANDEVDTLRTMVRDTTGLVVDQAYWIRQSSQAAVQVAAAIAAQEDLAPRGQRTAKTEFDELTEKEIDEMSGSQAREALKILAATSQKSLAAISCVRSMHALVHSPPGRETPSPSDDEVFTDENLAMIEGTVVAWGRMARRLQEAQQAQVQSAGRLMSRERGAAEKGFRA